MEHEHLTGKIIHCAHVVWNELGFGFIESIYETCLVRELRAAGLAVETQKPVAVFYKGEKVAEFLLDLLVEGTVVVELKSVEHLLQVHEVQLVNYLKATNKPVGLLLNFGRGGVVVKRKVKDLPERNEGRGSVHPVHPVHPVEKDPILRRGGRTWPR